MFPAAAIEIIEVEPDHIGGAGIAGWVGILGTPSVSRPAAQGSTGLQGPSTLMGKSEPSLYFWLTPFISHPILALQPFKSHANGVFKRVYRPPSVTKVCGASRLGPEPATWPGQNRPNRPVESRLRPVRPMLETSGRAGSTGPPIPIR